MNDYKLFYKAKDGVTADIIPYFEGNTFYLYYLHDYRDSEKFGEGTPWYLISSSDFTEYKEFGEVLNRGSVEEQDLYVFTGSIIKIGMKYHIFYTGHIPHFEKKGLVTQAVMHAVSNDMISWEKIPDDTFFAEEGYEVHDWRDPFVFYNEESHEYWMLLAAKKINGNRVRNGATTLLTSKDAKKWKVKNDLWAPKHFFTHECPDLFRIGEWWYLVYSEFSDRCQTRYRMSKSIDGTWLAPKNDSFDGRAFYAAKTATNGENRYIFGWNPTRKSNDNSHWMWGGNLVIHEVYQIDNGELRVKLPKSIEDYFNVEIYRKEEITINSEEGCKEFPFDVELPNRFKIEFEFEFNEYVSEFGLLLRHNQVNDRGYYYSINPLRNRFAFDVFPNHPWDTTNFLNVEKFSDFKPNKRYKFQLLVENDICVAYLNDELALSSRMHENNGMPYGLLSIDGITKYYNVIITKRLEK